MDLGEYFRFFMALAFVLLLIAGLAALVRRSGFGERLAANPNPGSERRLALIEVRPLDAKRKLVLLRRDDREHLVLLGATGDLLIESDIPAPPAKPAMAVEAGGGAAVSGPDNLLGRVFGKLRRQAT
jgi:flagellar protein FliO/FliZ